MQNKLCKLLTDQRLITVMKFSILAYGLVVAALVQAGPTSGQGVLDTKITMQVEGVSLHLVLDKISESGKINFIYSGNGVLEAIVSIKAKDKKLKELLDELLTPYDLGYKVKGKKIVITRKRQQDESLPKTPAETTLTEENPQNEDENKGFVLALITVTGTVTDASTKLPMAGVNIIEKGTANGTATDAEGKYTLNIEEDDAILVFSFIGYTAQELAVNGRSVIDVVLSEDVHSLSEIVVIGYATQNKELLSTAITTIGGEQLGNKPVSNVTQALVGQVSGVQLQQVNGAPGAAPSVRIRGNGSITSGNSPLYVIDGFPMTAADVNSISPNDIESVDVLKDAASAAIYGSRAGNGVIIVTTKKGKPGKTKFSFNSLVGFDEVTKKIDLLEADEYVEMAKESLINQGRPIPEYFTNESLWTSTDWQDVIFRTAPVQSYQFGANGGNENIRFNMSLGYLDQQGIVLNSYMKRYNLNAGFDAKLNKYISGGVNILSSYT